MSANISDMNENECAESLEQEITQDNQEMQIDDRVPWNDLPGVVITNIYSFLPDNDRLALSRVCQRWSEYFNDPCLWRHRKFRFGSSRSKLNESERAIGFAKRHAPHLKSLVIFCEHPSFHTCKKFQKTIDSFFNLLSRNRRTDRHCLLKELFMSGLQMERYWRLDRTREKAVISMCNFLRHQRKLEVLDLSESAFPVTSGLRILEAVGRACGRTLRILNMEDFFQSRIGLFRVSRFRGIVTHFRWVTSLYTNYNYLSEELVDLMAESLAGRLTYLSIKVYRNDPHFHNIPGQTWRKLKKSCPGMKVQMYLEGIGEHSEIINVCSRELPVSGIQMWSGVRHQEDDWDLDATLSYFGDHYGATLEEVSLSLENNREVIDEGFLHLLNKCRRLEYLDLQAVLLVPSIQVLYDLQRQYKIGLLRCHITLENLTGVELNELDLVNTQNQDLLEERGLDFEILANDLPFY